MRIMGVDFGERRIGIAISDPTGLIATPWGVIQRVTDQGAAEDVAALACREGVERVIVGLPLDAQGEEGPQARRVRRFVSLLAGGLSVPLVMWDESFSSHDAHEVRRRAGARRKARRRPIDDLAAAVLLQSYLDRRPRGEP